MKRITFLTIFALLLSACTNAALPTSTFTPTEPVPTAAATETPNLPPTVTSTAIPSPTATSIPYNVEVLAFHDLNGNESQDTNEPHVSGIKIEIPGLQSCITSFDGKCSLGKLFSGRHSLMIDSSDSSIENLDYVFSNREVFKAKSGFPIVIEGDSSISIALGQGFIPIPIAAESFRGILYGFGDLHYLNGKQVPHAGLDIAIKGNSPQPIFAPISGEARPNPDGTWGDCNHVTIWYNQLDFDIGIGMGHLTKVVVKPNALVQKGEIIGYIDPTLYHSSKMIACTSDPHIHMNIWGNIPGETWPHEDSGLPWQVLPASKWGWLNPEKYLPMLGKPVPMFDTIDQANLYGQE